MNPSIFKNLSTNSNKIQRNHFIYLLHQSTLNKSLTQTKQIHLQMLVSNFPYIAVGNKLVDSYLKSNSLDYARNVFDQMPKPHIVSYNSMISSYIKSRRSNEAIKLFKNMIPNSLLPDEFTFSVIFKAYSDVGLALLAGGTHALLIVLGLNAQNAFIGSALIDVYSKFRKINDAFNVYDRIIDKDVVCSTALINGLSQNGNDTEAIQVFIEMFNSGVKANDFTFSSVLISCADLKEEKQGKTIHGLIIKLGFSSKIASETSLLTMYSKCALVDDSLKVYESISSPNIVAWTAIIGCLVCNGKEEVALDMLQRMIQKHVLPNSFTLSTTLKGCASLALFNQAKSIHTIAIKIGLEKHKFVGASLIDVYGKCGHLQMAELIFESFSETDLVLANSMMYGYAQNGKGKEAVNLFYRIKNLGLELNDVTYVSVLSACSNGGLIEEGQDIFSDMTEWYKHKPSNEHHAIMVDLLGKAGKLNEAEELIKRVKKPDKVLWRTLLGACKIHGEVEMAKRVAREVIELDPSDKGIYILLTNVYASQNKWEEVRRMKCAMRDMGVKKEPAMTWIEVDRKVHTFMAGDDGHLKSKEIFEMVKILVEKTKEAGYVPDTKFVLQEMEEREKERSLFYHSEKLAIACGVLRSNGRDGCITIYKNLRVCGDCHSWIKFVSKVVGKEIIARDAKRFHHFKDGVCSCGDYW